MLSNYEFLYLCFHTFIKSGAKGPFSVLSIVVKCLHFFLVLRLFHEDNSFVSYVVHIHPHLTNDIYHLDKL